MNEKFTCDCLGEIIVIDETHVKHKCLSIFNKHQYADQPYIIYERVESRFKLGNGEPKYNWFVSWDA